MEIIFEKKIEVSDFDLSCILLNAIEGDCTYWCQHIGYEQNDYNTAKTKLNNPYFEDVILQLMKDGHSTLWKDDNGINHMMTFNDFINGIKRHMQETNNYDVDTYDAIDADYIIQYALFNNVIYR